MFARMTQAWSAPCAPPALKSRGSFSEWSVSPHCSGSLPGCSPPPLFYVAMIDVQISLQIYRALYYWLAGEIPTSVGAGHVSAVPIDLFRTADHGLVIDANTEEVFARLCGALGRPEWITDPNFKDRMARWHNKKELLAAIQTILLTKTRGEWMEILITHEVPCGPVNSVADILNDRHVFERPMMVATQHPTAGELKLLASPVKFPAHGELPLAPPPLLGQHTNICRH